MSGRETPRKKNKSKDKKAFPLPKEEYGW